MAASRKDGTSILGGGPTGALLGILLRQQGIDSSLYEARPDPRSGSVPSGRSINLALADRGIHALRTAGVFERIADAMMPMRGRLIHQDGGESLQLYGSRPSEVIYSISRHRLNQALLEVAEEAGVDLHFGHRLEALDFERGSASIQDTASNRLLELPMSARPLLATDGAGSPTRRAMTAAGLIGSSEAELAHGYKELTIPAAPDGDYRMARDVLHIWPRGDFMLIALPNTDGSFTATLFLQRSASPSFESLDTDDAVDGFLRTQFPDAHALMPGCIEEFREHPLGSLGTVHADRWHVGGSAALIGDAAHAIVPFHGQGMNCCLEDCVQFAECVARNAGWEAVFEQFFAARKPNTDAIAAMALENYREMREHVADPKFRLSQALALELERRHPRRFIPRYSMVMFHHEIPYAVAQRRGAVQSRLLSRLTAGAATLEDIDYARAEREINRELAPLAPYAPAS